MSSKGFRVVKPEIRVLGIDDGAFTPRTKGFAPIVGVVFRGGYWLDGVMHAKIRIDGLDATEEIGSMIVNSPHYKQLRVIMLNGVTFAGFNVVNIKLLNAETSLPVIVVSRDRPSFAEIHAALRHLPDAEERWKAVQDAGELFEVHVKGKPVAAYMEIAGISEKDARKIVTLTSTRSNIPEPLRVAHLIASGISV